MIDPRGQECTCSPGYQGSKCDWVRFTYSPQCAPLLSPLCHNQNAPPITLTEDLAQGPVPPTDYSNRIDWTPERVARVSLALDAATAASQNQNINGVMGTTVEEQCPSLDQDYHYFHLYNFATMTIEECGGILSVIQPPHLDASALFSSAGCVQCGRETVDTQATFGVVRASAAPSGRTELMIAFRGTEGNAVLTSLQKFQDVTSDLAIGESTIPSEASSRSACCSNLLSALD